MTRGIGGLGELKTALKGKIRSKPEAEGEDYLRMYLINKEEERLRSYQEVLRKSTSQTSDSLVEIATEMEKLRRKLASDLHATPIAAAQSSNRPGRKSPRGKRRKPFVAKTLTLDY
jgi:hypothetical protein